MSETTTGARVLQLAPPVDPTKPTPEPDVLDALERWYARACAGQIRGLALVGILGDDSVTQELVSGDGCQLRLLAGVTLQQHRLSEILREGAHTTTEPEEPEPGGEGGA